MEEGVVRLQRACVVCVARQAWRDPPVLSKAAEFLPQQNLDFDTVYYVRPVYDCKKGLQEWLKLTEIAIKAVPYIRSLPLNLQYEIVKAVYGIGTEIRKWVQPLTHYVKNPLTKETLIFCLNNVKIAQNGRIDKNATIELLYRDSRFVNLFVLAAENCINPVLISKLFLHEPSLLKSEIARLAVSRPCTSVHFWSEICIQSSGDGSLSNLNRLIKGKLRNSICGCVNIDALTFFLQEIQMKYQQEYILRNSRFAAERAQDAEMFVIYYYRLDKHLWLKFFTKQHVNILQKVFVLWRHDTLFTTWIRDLYSILEENKKDLFNLPWSNKQDMTFDLVKLTMELMGDCPSVLWASRLSIWFEMWNELSLDQRYDILTSDVILKMDRVILKMIIGTCDCKPQDDTILFDSVIWKLVQSSNSNVSRLMKYYASYKLDPSFTIQKCVSTEDLTWIIVKQFMQLL